MIQLGKTIKKLRVEKELSQKQLAEDAEITASFLSLIENDHREPSLAVLERLARSLHTPAEVLLWDAVELPAELSDEDLRMCEFAKLVVRRYYEAMNAKKPRKTKSKK